jgi:hypothetical protein
MPAKPVSRCSCILNAWDATVIHSLVQSPRKAMPIFIFDNQQISSLKNETEIVFLLLCSNVLKSLFLSETWYMWVGGTLLLFFTIFAVSRNKINQEALLLFTLHCANVWHFEQADVAMMNLNALLFTSMSICLNWSCHYSCWSQTHNLVKLQ